MTAFETLIDVSQLARHLDDPDWRVLDARFNLMATEAGREAYRQAHIPGAHYVHLDEQLSAPITADSGRHPLPSLDELTTWFAAVGIDSQTQVVVYDDMSGAMAARCWWLLKTLGHERVAVLNGGLAHWSQSHQPTDQRSPELSTSAAPSFDWHTERLVTSHQVLENLDTEAFLLVDARTSERFRGELEPIDPVAGHVPKALNRSLQKNLQADGRFKTAEQLAQEWRQLLGGRPAEQVVHMCGSGVTACHNQLAMSHAGLFGSRVYAGSWSEWIRDSNRPVATGG